jgi:hypothetical protein
VRETAAAATAGATRSGTVVIVIGLWLIAATVLAMTPLVALLQPPAPPFVVFGLAFTVLAAGRLSRGFGTWLATVDLRWLVGLHLTRFVGAYFLYLYAHGRLPHDFAVPGGVGDVAVATLAAVLLLWGPPRDAGRRAAYGAWNVLGLLDILFVVVTAGRRGLANAASMAELLQLPLSLLPTFLVPLIIASHVVLGARLWLARVRRP